MLWKSASVPFSIKVAHGIWVISQSKETWLWKQGMQVWFHFASSYRRVGCLCYLNNVYLMLSCVWIPVGWRGAGDENRLHFKTNFKTNGKGQCRFFFSFLFGWLWKGNGECLKKKTTTFKAGYIQSIPNKYSSDREWIPLINLHKILYLKIN